MRNKRYGLSQVLLFTEGCKREGDTTEKTVWRAFLVTNDIVMQESLLFYSGTRIRLVWGNIKIKLREKEATEMARRFQLDGDIFEARWNILTYREVGAMRKRSAERARQLIAAARRRLKHPDMMKLVDGISLDKYILEKRNASSPR